jgi:hypothetical protein
LDLVELDAEATPLRPAHEHAQQHLGPVLRVGAARTRVDLADGVALVVLAGEERAQLQRVEIGGQRRGAGVDLRLDRIVALFTSEHEQGLDLGEPLLEAVEDLEVVAHPSQLGIDLARLVLVLPQVRSARLLLELGQPVPRRVDLQ